MLLIQPPGGMARNTPAEMNAAPSKKKSYDGPTKKEQMYGWAMKLTEILERVIRFWKRKKKKVRGTKWKIADLLAHSFIVFHFFHPIQ
jgi:hypothetical protein